MKNYDNHADNCDCAVCEDIAMRKELRRLNRTESEEQLYQLAYHRGIVETATRCRDISMQRFNKPIAAQIQKEFGL